MAQPVLLRGAMNSAMNSGPVPCSTLFHNYIAINPKNAEAMMTALANQMALMVKHIELLNGDSGRFLPR